MYENILLSLKAAADHDRGNTYYIIMDLLRKTAKTGSNLGPAFFEKSIELTKKGFNDLEKLLTESGYELIYI